MSSFQMNVHHPPFCVCCVWFHDSAGRRDSRDSNQVRTTRYGIIIHFSHNIFLLVFFYGYCRSHTLIHFSYLVFFFISFAISKIFFRLLFSNFFFLLRNFGIFRLSVCYFLFSFFFFFAFNRYKLISIHT